MAVFTVTGREIVSLSKTKLRDGAYCVMLSSGRVVKRRISGFFGGAEFAIKKRSGGVRVTVTIIRGSVVALAALFALQSPAQPGFSPADLFNAADYSKNKGGSAVLVMQNGSIIYENYHNGADSNTAAHIHSATKAFWSAIAALALNKGLIESYDEPVSRAITEWRDTVKHPGKNHIKIRHLLSLSSGLSQDVEKIQGLDAEATDIYRYVVDSLRLIAAPGTFFQYGPSHYYVFGELLRRKLHAVGNMMNPLHYLESELFDKIGLEYATWAHDSSGNPHIPNGCFLTPRNWVKFGRFMLQKGRWDGIQIIDSNSMKTMFTADGPNPGHGKFLWLNAKDGYGINKLISAPPGFQGGFIYHHGFADMIGALGAGCNRMYMLPTLHAVILRQTLVNGDTFDDHAFLSLLLNTMTNCALAGAGGKNTDLYLTQTRKTVHIHTGNRKIKSVKLSNLKGALLREYAANDCPVSNCPAGIYLFTVEIDKSIVTFKLMVR